MDNLTVESVKEIIKEVFGDDCAPVNDDEEVIEAIYKIDS